MKLILRTITPKQRTITIKNILANVQQMKYDIHHKRLLKK